MSDVEEVKLVCNVCAAIAAAGALWWTVGKIIDAFKKRKE